MQKTKVNGRIDKPRPVKDILASKAVNLSLPVLDEDRWSELSRKRIEVEPGKYVPFFSRDSDFVKLIQVLLNNSPTLRSIIKQKSTLVVGSGFIPRNFRKSILIFQAEKESISPADPRLMDLEGFVQSVNLYGESLLDIAYKVAFDYFASGNAFIELVKAGKEEKKAFFVNHIDYDKVRIKLPESPEDLPDTVGISIDWDRYNYEKEAKPDEVSLYPNFSRSDDGSLRSVIHIKEYGPGFDFYGVPEWISALLWSEIEYRIPKYNVSQFKNAFLPSSIIQLFGATTEEEAKDIVDKLVEKFTDTGNNNKIFVQVLRDERLKANVQTIEDKSEGNYLELQQLASQAIVTALRWTTSLAGIATAGRLGSNEQIKHELEIVQNTAIAPVQSFLESRIINPIVREASDWLGKSFGDISLSFSVSTPISFIGDIDPEANLTTNEKREILGFDPLDDQQSPNNDNPR